MHLFLIALLLLWNTGFLQAAEPPLLLLQMEQNPATVHPQHDLLPVRIMVKRSNGEPVSNAQLHIKVQAPPTPWLASTDFPVVEGSLLLDTEVQIDRGEYKFQFVPPIRGVYTIMATVRPLPGDSSLVFTQQQWQTEIFENPAKKLNLAVLLLILILVGSISGFVLGRSSVPAAILLVLLSCFHAKALKAHGNEHHGSENTKSLPQNLSSPQGTRVLLQLLTGNPRVGNLTSLQARFLDSHGHMQPARFRLQVTQLEHQKEVFATVTVATDGIFHWQGQFFDGSDHRVLVEAVPLSMPWNANQTARAELDIAVEGVAPPLRSVVKSLGFLLAVTAAALATGIALGRFFPRKEGDFI